jgi:uncharacterized damage-inducible protein DinB
VRWNVSGSKGHENKQQADSDGDSGQRQSEALAHEFYLNALEPQCAAFLRAAGGNARMGSMALRFTTSYLLDSLDLFRYYKKLAERAMAQVTDGQLLAVLDGEMNSIAVIVKHMAGNMRSRWTDFLTSDGEKPDRARDAEFTDPPATRETLLAIWEEGWQCMFNALERLSEEDLQRTVTIRGEAHSVMQAINRQVAHYSYHCGQIVLLAKHFKHDEWQSLSIPRRQSTEFTRRVVAGEASQR